MHQAEESDLVPFFELTKQLELTLKTIILLDFVHTISFIHIYQP